MSEYYDECYFCPKDATVFTVVVRRRYIITHQYCDVCIELERNAEDIRFATREARDLWLIKREL